MTIPHYFQNIATRKAPNIAKKHNKNSCIAHHNWTITLLDLIYQFFHFVPQVGNLQFDVTKLHLQVKC